MKVARLKVVRSAQWWHGPDDKMVSVRGPQGSSHNDPAQPHITEAGFEPGEDVVLILASDFDRLTKENA
jgi:hypothetical protein